jgi:hypothetical protein
VHASPAALAGVHVKRFIDVACTVMLIVTLVLLVLALMRRW